MTAHGPQIRPMRRDAVRNHRLVVEAAREVLAEFGTDASMELIASRAGVGVGTVYRRFPNKEALVDEIARQILIELVDEARLALDRADGTGLEDFLWVIGRSLSKHHGYADKLVGSTKVGCVEQLRDLISELLAQAKENGRIGADVTLGDIMTLAWGLRGVVETAGAVVPDAWQRHLDIHLAGLRAAFPVSERPAVTREQLTLVNESKPQR
ncbi:TetR/AcrR family transcriptional regulator [Streptomyces sp. NBC_01190]|uniref:TetR/AcrR family transcriptional regulator n=1 Tax=Streptomyces sp. NBC_01190 TaxID=2903767 RepID=UPI00386A951E|nr:TetR/AcrR family transcriptional regulator [Streptomyces sp. NBC_01190]